MLSKVGLRKSEGALHEEIETTTVTTADPPDSGAAETGPDHVPGPSFSEGKLRKIRMRCHMPISIDTFQSPIIAVVTGVFPKPKILLSPKCFF